MRRRKTHKLVRVTDYGHPADHYCCGLPRKRGFYRETSYNFATTCDRCRNPSRYRKKPQVEAPPRVIFVDLDAGDDEFPPMPIVFGDPVWVHEPQAAFWVEANGEEQVEQG